MRRIVLTALIFVNVFVLSACGKNNDQSPYFLFYRGSVEQNIYYIGYFESDINLVVINSLGQEEYRLPNEYHFAGIIDSDYILVYAESFVYKLWEYKTNELITIDLGVSGTNVFEYSNDEYIIFSSNNDLTDNYILYDYENNVISDSYSIVKDKRDRFSLVTIVDNNIYMKYVYETHNNNYSFIYDMTTSTFKKYETGIENPYVFVHDDSLLVFTGNTRKRFNGYLMNNHELLQSGYADYYQYDESLVFISNSFINYNHSDNAIDIYTSEFSFVNRYQVNSVCDAFGVEVVTDSQYVCYQEQVYGSLLKRTERRLHVINFKDNEILYSTEWFDLGGQIDRRK
jgi:hypothetical protein